MILLFIKVKNWNSERKISTIFRIMQIIRIKNNKKSALNLRADYLRKLLLHSSKVK